VEWASANGFVIVTRDKDFARLHQQGLLHAGIAYCPGRHLHTVGENARLLADIERAESLESMYGNLRYF
jgi:hypothetical protein